MPHPDPHFVWPPVSLRLEQSCPLRRANGGSFVRVTMQEQVAPHPRGEILGEGLRDGELDARKLNGDVHQPGLDCIIA